MSSSSSSSSRLSNRRSVRGVPTRCWCGRNLVTYAAQTKDNPFRRFYRCELALQRKTEEHIFKWIDEALLDETKMVEEKLEEEVKELRKEMVKLLDLQSSLTRKMEKEVKEKVEEKVKEKLEEKLKEESMIATETKKKMAGEMAREMAKTCMQKLGITVLVFGTIGWLCGKVIMS
ncbi:unnamed protein product [Microthlaspi erraticum]|uniref:GRF-type domain-containing protein n=1 Tax=Microthlaspi erraticum TaxID=1685480 RepID=A0A6D2HTI4_9BRAS|nr:unnamed protein product [Microthlaspi erraticum]